MVSRTLVRRAMGGTLALGFALAAEVMWAAHWKYPHFPDLDASGSVGDPAKPPLRILALGDSTTTGPGLDDPDEIWIRQLARTLTDRYHVTIRSFAKGGARIAHVLDTQLPQAEGLRADIATVSVAANDALRGMSAQDMEEALARVVEQALRHAAAVVLLGVGDVGTAPRLPVPVSLAATARARATDRVHQRVASRFDRAFKIEMWERTTPQFRSDPDLFSPDRFHPNGRGHALWAAAAVATIEEAIRAIRTAPDPPPGRLAG